MAETRLSPLWAEEQGFRIIMYVIDEYVLSLQEADAVSEQKAAKVQPLIGEL